MSEKNGNTISIKPKPNMDYICDPKTEWDDQTLLSRMALNVNKAGMLGLDKEKINK